jgi:hypothetical protein
MRFFAALRMTWAKGSLRMTGGKGLTMTDGEGLRMTDGLNGLYIFQEFSL